MKQLLILASLLSFLFSYNNRESATDISPKVNGGWTLIGNYRNTITYYDASNKVVKQSPLPLTFFGTVIKVKDDKIFVRNNKDELVYVAYNLVPYNSTQGLIAIEDPDNKERNELISLIAGRMFYLQQEGNKNLVLSTTFDKSANFPLLSTDFDFDHAVVKIVLGKNSFFSDFLPD